MFLSRRLVAFAASTLPFGAPPFDKIADADYLPAFETGMAPTIVSMPNRAWREKLFETSWNRKLRAQRAAPAVEAFLRRRFREPIVSKGHSEEYSPMFRSFYGKDPQVGPLLRARGLIGPSGG